MDFNRKIKEITDALADRISLMRDTPELFPHTVFCEEVNSKGAPCYVSYKLLRLQPLGKCILKRTFGNHEEEERDLTEINLEWLLTVWERYCELCEPTYDTERIYNNRYKERLESKVKTLADLGLGTPEIRAAHVLQAWDYKKSDEENIEKFRFHMSMLEAGGLQKK